MSVVFTCDLCGTVCDSVYDGPEGWYSLDATTLQYWNKIYDKDSYMVKVLCNVGCFSTYCTDNKIITTKYGYVKED